MGNFLLTEFLPIVATIGTLGLIPRLARRRDLRFYRDEITSNFLNNYSRVELSSNEKYFGTKNWSLAILSIKKEEFLTCFVNSYIDMYSGERQYNYAMVYRKRIYANGLSQTVVNALLAEHDWPIDNAEDNTDKVILIHAINDILKKDRIWK